jgi:hypothetical protein
LEEKRNSVRHFEEAQALLIELVLRVFVAFAKEGYKLGVQNEMSVEELESECTRFLMTYALETGLLDDVLSVPTRSDAPIPIDVRRKIESSDEWKTYRRLLQLVAEVQAEEEEDSVGPLASTPTEGEPPAPATGVISESGGDVRGAVNIQAAAERATRRQAVVMPILANKRWKRGRLATEAGLGKNSVYEYLDGTRAKISIENRKALADALDVAPEEIPD